MMKHTKTRKSTIGWWLMSIIPILNFYWNWKVSKIVAEHEEE